MTDTAKNAFAAVIARLETILISNGYNTNAGGQVYPGVRYFCDDETFPLIALFTGDETIEKLTPNQYRAGRSINIEAYVQDAAAPTIALEELIEDIQRATEGSDESLGGIVNVLDYTGIEEIDPPEAGSDISGVRITYVIEFDRDYGT